MKGLIHLYTGDGKGKTTAAFGLALRAAGAGKKVFIMNQPSEELFPLFSLFSEFFLWIYLLYHKYTSTIKIGTTIYIRMFTGVKSTGSVPVG